MTILPRLVRLLVLLCALAVGTAVPASAQGYGAKAGITVATVVIDPADALGLDVRGQSGLLGGAFVTFGAMGPATFQVDALISLRRVAFGDDIEDKLTYLEVPIVAKFGVFRRESLVINALGGASVNYLLQARESVVGADSFDIKDAHKALDLAAVVGAQAAWNDRWVFEGRYLLGLSETYAEAPDGVRSRQRAFQVTAGYRFK